MSEDLQEMFAAIERARSQPAKSILAGLEGVPPPAQPPQHYAHVLDWIRHEAFVQESARTAEFNANMAVINRARFDHATREGLAPFQVVQNEDES